MNTFTGTIKSVSATKFGSALNLVEDENGFFSNDPISANTFSVGDKVEITVYKTTDKGYRNFYFRQVKLIEKGNGAAPAQASAPAQFSTYSDAKGEQIRRQGLLQSVVSNMTIDEVRSRTQEIADTVSLLERYVLTGSFGLTALADQQDANPFLTAVQ